MKKIIPLNDNWLFRPYFDPAAPAAGGETVSLPHGAELLPRSYPSAAGGVTSYTRLLELPETCAGSRIILRFEGVLSYAEVYANDIFVTSHKGETPFEADVTAPVKYGFQNKIVVKVDSSPRPDVPFSGFAGGGIHRPVSLRLETGEVIKDVFVRTAPDGSGGDRLKIDVELGDFYPDAVIAGRILDADGTVAGVLPEKAVLRPTGILEGRVEGANRWSPGSPALYTAHITLSRGGAVLDEARVKFGFRTFEWKRSGLYLNGRRLKLIGLNRIDSYPVAGRAMPASLQIADAEILRKILGCNAVRVHGTPAREFIEACDALGLIVITDLSGGGVLGGPQWRDALCANITELIRRDRNSPSVAAWGTRVNGSRDFDELYFKTNKAAADADPTRCTVGARSFMGSRMYEDIFGYNDYAKAGKLSRPSKTGKLFVPYLVTEHTGRLLPVKPFDNAALRLEQALAHLGVIDKMLGSRKIAGAFGAAFCDYAGDAGGDGNCYYGVLDAGRMPKTAAYAYASQSDARPVLELGSDFSPDEYPGRLYIFTNCDLVRVTRGGRAVGDFYPDRRRYKHLPHPPVVIKSFAGIIDGDEKLNAVSERIFRYILGRVQRRTYLGLSRFDKFLCAVLRRAAKLDRDGFDALIEKYSAAPQKSERLKFEGIKNGEVVAEAYAGGGGAGDIAITPQSVRLTARGTYDAARVEIESRDACRRTRCYDFSPVSLSADGAAEILGPTEFSLTAGRGAFYVRSVAEGKGTVKIRCGSTEKILETEVIYETVGRL
ncbi:MAG: hypothetical protein LBP26_02470 [Clostridiales bacterium]|jgi:beta-galactosidase|nr:hypothetical protein [Clostridiales bacterium]